MEIRDPQRSLPPPPNTKPSLIPTSSSSFSLQTFIFYILLFSFGLVIGATFFPFNNHRQPEFSLPSPPDIQPNNLTTTLPPPPDIQPNNLTTTLPPPPDIQPNNLTTILPPPPDIQPNNLTTTTITVTTNTNTNTTHSITNDDELLRKASMAGSGAKEKQNKKTKKIAFLFLVIGELPLAPLWEMFFRGYEGMYTIYVHSHPAYNESVPPTSVFFGRRIPSKEVQWGQINMVEAERRLLARALLDDDSNHHFLLLSESCIPLFNFSTVYSYLTSTSTTFVESFDQPGPTGWSRYNPKMLPTIALSHWRKGSQWFHLDRTIARAVVSDHKYFPLFRQFCQTACYGDEHYLPTFVNIKFRKRISNRSLTWVEWTLKQAHPVAFQRPHVTPEFLRRLRGGYTCEYNGETTNVCYLFARKFMPSCLTRLMAFAPMVMQFGSHRSRH